MLTVHCNWVDNPVWCKTADSSFNPRLYVDIWNISIPDFMHQISALKNILREDELARGKRYHHERDRNRFLIARALLRIILSKYLHTSSDSIQISIGKNKKPFIESSGPIAWHYNTTHSGEYILIGISGSPIGVDVEKIDMNFAYKDILLSNFSDKEISFVNGGPGEREHFYTLWTRKEALVKGTGKGMDEDFQEIPCLDGNHQVLEKTIGAAEDWQVESFRLSDQYIAAVAHVRTVHSLRFWHADPFILHQ